MLKRSILQRSDSPAYIEEKDLPEIRLLEKALGIRLFEERLLKLFTEGRLFGTVHTCIGEEWTGVALAEHLQSQDTIFSNHRCHGHYLARSGNFAGLFAEIMGREGGICQGRGGSQHICDNNVFSNGIQGGIVPVAAGLALASKLRGTGAISVVFIGDGTLGEGVLYESMNLASIWDLPLLIVLENNLYAQSTAQKQTLGGSIEARAEAFGLSVSCADTWDPMRLIEMMGQAVSAVRKQQRAHFLRVDTYRLMAHSKSDDNRDLAELAAFRERDLLHRLLEQKPEMMYPLREHIQRVLDRAVEEAEQTPIADTLEIPEVEEEPTWEPTHFIGGERVVGRIYQGLLQSLNSDERVVLLGEDIEGPYGGAFKATKDLSQLFPGRVRNTPISEQAIAGISNGMALAGMKPVLEIMFGDFILLALDQIINHAAKFNYMYGGQVRTPLVVRTPMGGKRGYGPTHSQSLEKHLLGVPGTRVIALHHRFDPAVVYERLLGGTGPDIATIVLENKILYGEKVSPEAVAGFSWYHSSHSYPLSYMHAEARADAAILCYGGMLVEAEKAIDRLFVEHDLVVELICPMQIYPLQIGSILSLAQRSGRLLLVEEGHGFCGWTAETMAALLEQDPRLVIRRLYSHPQHIPSAKPLELRVLPGVDRIMSEIVELLK